MTTPELPATPAAGSLPQHLAAQSGTHVTPIDSATFHEALALVRPAPAEMQWASIPWQTDLWEARKLAQETGKPIFMWAMNGNPLGCV